MEPLGSGYEPSALVSALERRELIELAGLIRPASDLPLYLAGMAAWPGTSPAWRLSQASWVEANDACRRDILDRLSATGPLSSREIPDTCAVPWQSSGWNNDRNVVRLLDFMAARGEVAVSGRRGPDRLFDLASRVYPAAPVVPLDQARRLRDARRLSSLGLARSKGQDTQVEPGGVGEAGEPAVIEGVRGPWRVDPQLLGLPFSPRVALLSPLDRTIFDRKRMADIFEFDYQLEMYKPARRRRWGYYALPILVGDRLIGKVDATDPSTELVWVPTADLLAAGVDPWMGVPLWIGDPAWAAANLVDGSRAAAAGLTTRALADTAADVLAWDVARGGPPAEPFTADREKALLARFVNRSTAGFLRGQEAGRACCCSTVHEARGPTGLKFIQALTWLLPCASRQHKK